MSSKRRRLAAAPYYQEWHIYREQETLNIPQEWYVDVPLPLEGAPSGLYWAIEIRSLIYKIGPVSLTQASGVVQYHCDVCLTSSPRTNKTPFITGPSHPDNIWWYDRNIHIDKETFGSGTYHHEYTRATNKCELTDHKGTGKLLVGPHLFVQIDTNSTAAQVIELCLEYNYVLVKCQQLLGVYQGRLNEA